MATKPQPISVPCNFNITLKDDDDGLQQECDYTGFMWVFKQGLVKTGLRTALFTDESVLNRATTVLLRLLD